MTALIELSDHLIDLLFRQKRVVLPDFGSFEFHIQPAEILPADNKINPPVYELLFKPYSNNTADLSFADFLILEKSYDPYDAGIKIKAFIYQIRNALEQTGKCYLPNFGTLTKDETGIHFSPIDRLKIARAGHGLPQLDLFPVNRSFNQSQIITNDSQSTFIDNSSEFITSEKNKWITPLIVTFLLLGAGLVGYYFYKMYSVTDSSNRSNTEQVNQSLINHDSLVLSEQGFEDTISTVVPDNDSAAYVHTEQNYSPDPPASDQTVSNETDKNEVEKPKPEETKMNPDVLLTTTEADCAVIVGVMAQKTNVKKLAAHIRKLGYTPFSYVSNGLTRIGAASACDDATIAKTLADMQQINQDAWVYKSR